MTDDYPSREESNTPSFPAKSDYNGLEQNTDGHNTLDTNLNVIFITFVISLIWWKFIVQI